MANVVVQDYTPLFPITMIGYEAGVCFGADVRDVKKNYKRGMECIYNHHGRTFEFPDVYLELHGYSARVIREWYTHVGGVPTRLQESTRRVNYKDDFRYVTPDSIAADASRKKIYDTAMEHIRLAMTDLEDAGVPREDAALLLPLGMETKIVCKHNARNLMDMSRQRECSKAYHEYRALFNDVKTALSNYSEEWRVFVNLLFYPKCKELGYCPEKNSCGRWANESKRAH